MDNFKQQSPIESTKIGKVVEFNLPEKIQQEDVREMLPNKVIDTKQTINASIEIKTKIVQDILSSLEGKRLEDDEVSAQKGEINPEKILIKIRAELAELRTPSIEDIARAVIRSGLVIQDVHTWLSSNREEIEILTSSKENLERQNSEISQQLDEESRKNLFIKLFRGTHRQELQRQSRDLIHETRQVDLSLRELDFHQERIRREKQEILDRQQELALSAIQELCAEIVEKNKQFKKTLLSPEIKKELNERLIVQKVLPELEQLQEEGKVSKEDAQEFLELLKMQCIEGRISDWNDSIEKKATIEARTERVYELDKKSGYTLRDLSSRISVESSNIPADFYYDRIFDFLIKEVTREQIEQLHTKLGDSLSSELQEKLDAIVKETIQPHSIWQDESLDLRNTPIHNFKRLEGLERWSAVKDFTESSGVISKEVFAHVEKIIIQRLFNEQLFSGGRESWDGTTAAQKMGQFDNPEALPLLLQYIEVFGSGHTGNAVVHVMERLLKKSNPSELQSVLESLPKDKKVLLEILADENSYMSRFGRINSRYYTSYLLQNGNFTISKEQLTKILEISGELTEQQLKDFYLTQTEEPAEAIEVLLKSRTAVEDVIIESKLGVWSQTSDKLLAALVNPRNGESVAFPKRIAQEGIGISDEKLLGVFDKIFDAKTFKGSGFERETFLDGLILLNSKENGKAVLETLLDAYKGARSDPARMRRVFQLLSTLEGFGAYDFAAPEQAEIDTIEKEIADLQNQYKETQDKTERKKLKNRIDTLNTTLQNTIGLKGIEDAMTQKVVEVACEKLELSQEYRDKIKDNLDELLKSGIFEIIPALAGKYEGRNEVEVKDLLRSITNHIIEGDFKSWRYSHEKSGAQLSGLTEEQKAFWKEGLEPITIDIELPEDEKGRREDELKAAQEIIKNAKDHILDSQPDFYFSKERVQMLDIQIKKLTDQIKTTTSEKDKKEFALEKRVLQAEVNLINGILEIEKATAHSFSKEKILTHARELRERINELNLPLAGLDIEQIEKIFTVGDIKSVSAFESDDALTLLKVGVEPQETCQSWRSGGFNECLLAYVSDGNKKVLNVTDGEGKIVARSIIKLTKQKDSNDSESKTQRTTLLIEKPYSLLPNNEVYRAFARVLFMKAQGLDSSITFGRGFDRATIQIFEEEARTFGYTMSESMLDVYIPPSLNKYEYSDTLGGKISWFDRYQQLDAVTFEKVVTFQNS